MRYLVIVVMVCCLVGSVVWGEPLVVTSDNDHLADGGSLVLRGSNLGVATLDSTDLHRVALGNANSFGNCTHLVTLHCTQWMDNEVVATVDTDPFTAGDTVWAFVYTAPDMVIAVGGPYSIGAADTSSGPVQPGQPQEGPGKPGKPILN